MRDLKSKTPALPPIPDPIWIEILALVAGCGSTQPLWARVEAKRIRDQFPTCELTEEQLAEAIWRLAARRGVPVDDAL